MAEQSTSPPPTSATASVVRRAAAVLTGLALVVTLLAAAALAPQPRPDRDTTPVAGSDEVGPGFVSSCIGYCQRPTNAAKVFRWGREKWRAEFETRRLSGRWDTGKRHLVNNQYGMLTINAKPDTGSIRVSHPTPSARYGRWEARVRAREFDTRGAKYSFNWELVPVRKSRRDCGANSIVMSRYKTNDRAARGAVRVGPDTKYAFGRQRDLRSRAWHTYAVEVRPNRISWFVDTKVIATETRDHATQGLAYKPRFRIQGDPDKRMRRSWMQMDWVRHYTLERPNAKSVAAPRMDRSRWRGGC